MTIDKYKGNNTGATEKRILQRDNSGIGISTDDDIDMDGKPLQSYTLANQQSLSFSPAKYSPSSQYPELSMTQSSSSIVNTNSVGGK